MHSWPCALSHTRRGSPHPATLAAAAARSAASCSVSVGTLRVVLALLALTALALLDQLHLRLAPLLPWAAPPASGSFAWHDCAPRHPQIMVYNRIPKAGSTTLLVLLDKLAVANDFDVVMPTPYYDHPAALASIGAALASGRRTLVCNHFNYPELQYGGGQVAYMNVMRHPVDRCTSVYYYLRWAVGHSETGQGPAPRRRPPLLCHRPAGTATARAHSSSTSWSAMATPQWTSAWRDRWSSVRAASIASPPHRPWRFAGGTAAGATARVRGRCCTRRGPTCRRTTLWA